MGGWGRPARVRSGHCGVRGMSTLILALVAALTRPMTSPPRPMTLPERATGHRRRKATTVEEEVGGGGGEEEKSRGEEEAPGGAREKAPAEVAGMLKTGADEASLKLRLRLEASCWSFRKRKGGGSGSARGGRRKRGEQR